MSLKVRVASPLLLLAVGTGVLSCQQNSNNSIREARAAASGKAAYVSWTGTHQVEITDPHYQMLAATMNVPSGWKFAGAVARPPGCHYDGIASIVYTILSPDGITAIATLPREVWSWSTSPGMRQNLAKLNCPGVDIASSAGFLVNIAVPNMHPNAKIVGVFPLPAKDQAALAKQQTMLRQRFPNQESIVEGARVRIQYQRNGQPVEELITAAINCSQIAMPPLWPETTRSRQTHCATQSLGIIRAPQGHLDQFLAEPELTAVIESAHESDDWFHRMVGDQQRAFNEATAEFNRRAAQIRADGQKAEDRLVQNATAQREANERLGAASRANARATQDGIDAAAHNTVNYSLDRRDYVNPATGKTVTVSSEYSHTWVNSAGDTAIQTNDHGYDPNGRVSPVSQSWTELVPK